MSLLLVVMSLIVAATSMTSATAADPIRGDDRVRPGLGYSISDPRDSAVFDECSFAFLLAGSDGRQYVATAGHCAFVDEEERIWRKGDGPPVSNDAGRPVGQFVYAIEDSPRRQDFGLIRLSNGVKGNPQMCGWGGPTRLLTEARSGLTELHQHGQGFGFEDVSPNRTAFARSLPREHYSVVQGPFMAGDSGSPVTTADGAAVGVLAELTVGGESGAGIVRLEDAIRAATTRLGVRFTLRTAPLLPAPVPTAPC